MPGDPRIRASDADRDRVVTLLREHHAEGRLNAEEFNERLDKAFAAKTLGDLDALLADLPAIDLYRLPSAGIQPRPGTRRSRRRPGSNLMQDGGGAVGRPGEDPLSVREAGAWVAWAAVSTVLLIIWVGAAAADGGLAWLPWFLLIVLPWATILSRRSPH